MTLNMKPDLNAMPDVQGRRDLRAMPIQRVGVKSLRYPLRVMVGGKVQSTVGSWTCLWLLNKKARTCRA